MIDKFTWRTKCILKQKRILRRSERRTGRATQIGNDRITRREPVSPLARWKKMEIVFPNARLKSLRPVCGETLLLYGNASIPLFLGGHSYVVSMFLFFSALEVVISSLQTLVTSANAYIFKKTFAAQIRIISPYTHRNSFGTTEKSSSLLHPTQIDCTIASTPARAPI